MKKYATTAKQKTTVGPSSTPPSATAGSTESKKPSVFGRAKDLYNKHKHQLGPAVDFTKRCIDSLVEVKEREKPGVVDYIGFAFSVKDNYENAYKTHDPYSFFGTPAWSFVCGGNLCVIIVKLIQASINSRLTPAAYADSVATFVTEVDGIRFGWINYDDEDPSHLYVDINHDKDYQLVLEKLFWKVYASGRVVVGMEDDKIYVRDDRHSNDFHMSQKATDVSTDIQAFLDNDFGRSLLFYGPPGSGKSNFVKSLASSMNLRTLRLNNLSNVSTETTLEILRIFNPDGVILEDIDNITAKDISDMLDKVESMNKRKKVVLATCNEISRLDNALMRPGRFDEVIEICRLDKEVVLTLTNGDQEVASLMCDYPAAFITELMKRIKVRGREATLANYEDLKQRFKLMGNSNYTLNVEEENGDD